LVSIYASWQSSYKIAMKCSFCNFMLWMPGTIAPFAPPLHAPGSGDSRT